MENATKNVKICVYLKVGDLMNDVVSYPIEFDSYFKENEVVFKQIPEKYLLVNQKSLKNKRIKNTQQLIEYMTKEREFWDYPGVNNNHIVSSYKNTYSKSLADIENAIKLLSTNKIFALNNFKNAINNAKSTCLINSETQLAKLFKKFYDKSQYFFQGFENAIIGNPSSSYYNHNGWFEGFYFGMQYRNVIKSIEDYVQKYHTTYEEAVMNAETQISFIIENYTSLLHTQEQKVMELWTKNDEVLSSQKKDIDTYFETKKQELDDYLQTKDSKLIELETTYEEKLKLSKPAEYWGKMATFYTKNGAKWLIISLIVAVITIVGLIIFISLTPNIFDYNDDWYLIFKNTALLTVITSIAIYVLRITVKLCMSSMHLARDSREREQLAYFYLALSKEGEVSDKERAIILNSLFSRSDTGLLKGDSAPIMSANVTDIVNKSQND